MRKRPVAVLLGLTTLLGVASAQESMLSPPEPVTDVTLDVWPEPGAAPRRYTLRCYPPRGMVPRPDVSCARIAAQIEPSMRGQLPRAMPPDPPPAVLELSPPALRPRATNPNELCTQVYSPTVIRLHGLIGGIPVAGISGGRDGCELGGLTWTLRLLLGIP